MKLTQVCPKCSGRRFAVNGEMRIPDHRISNATVSVPAITVSAGDVSMEKDAIGDRYVYGHLEAWICLGCGYTETTPWGCRTWNNSRGRSRTR
jgi:predicted nucleic-acid-binding Zn-ribbon protein